MKKHDLIKTMFGKRSIISRKADYQTWVIENDNSIKEYFMKFGYPPEIIYLYMFPIKSSDDKITQEARKITGIN